MDGIVLLLEVLYDMLLMLLDESIGMDTGTIEEIFESNLSRLSVRRNENLLK